MGALNGRQLVFPVTPGVLDAGGRRKWTESSAQICTALPSFICFGPGALASGTHLGTRGTSVMTTSLLPGSKGGLPLPEPPSAQEAASAVEPMSSFLVHFPSACAQMSVFFFSPVRQVCSVLGVCTQCQPPLSCLWPPAALSAHFPQEAKHLSSGSARRELFFPLHLAQVWT